MVRGLPPVARPARKGGGRFGCGPTRPRHRSGDTRTAQVNPALGFSGSRLGRGAEFLSRTQCDSPFETDGRKYVGNCRGKSPHSPEYQQSRRSGSAGEFFQPDGGTLVFGGGRAPPPARRIVEEAKVRPGTESGGRDPAQLPAGHFPLFA